MRHFLWGFYILIEPASYHGLALFENERTGSPRLHTSTSILSFDSLQQDLILNVCQMVIVFSFLNWLVKIDLCYFDIYLLSRLEPNFLVWLFVFWVVWRIIDNFLNFWAILICLIWGLHIRLLHLTLMTQQAVIQFKTIKGYLGLLMSMTSLVLINNVRDHLDLLSATVHLSQIGCHVMLVVTWDKWIFQVVF